MGRLTGNRQVGRFFAVALILFIVGLGAGVARAQSELVVKIDDRASGPAIPEDFAGLSFESSNLLADKNGNYLFSGSNKDDPNRSKQLNQWAECPLGRSNNCRAWNIRPRRGNVSEIVERRCDCQNRNYFRRGSYHHGFLEWQVDRVGFLQERTDNS